MSAAVLRGGGRWAADVARRHPLLCDATVATLIAATSVVGLAIQDRVALITLGFCVALCLALLLRTVDRRLSFALVALIALGQWLLSDPQVADAAVLVALFWLALDAEPAEAITGAVVVQAGAIMAAVRWSPTQPVQVAIGITGLGVAAGAIGVTIRERRALVASMHERAARLERERDQEGEIAAAAERARIAREMHDIVSHNLTVMIGLADGASYALQESPDAAGSAMRRVSATGRQALAEMRRLLGVLHETPDRGSYEPQPGLDRLDDLLAGVEAAGVPVSIELTGDPHALSAGAQLTVFRVVQEALTNTLKHAGRPVSVHVSLRCEAERVELEVIDTGGPVRQRSPSPGGRGLGGMRQRAAAFGGELEAGPLPEGGWKVRLTLGADVATVAP